MRKTIFLIGLFLSITTSAQVLNVQSIDKVKAPANEMAKQVAAISPNGDYLLLCSQSQEGLIKLDLTTGKSKTLTTARGAGFGTRISDDGEIAAFQEVSFNQDRLLMRSVKSIDLKSGTTQTLLQPSREYQGFDLQRDVVATVANKQVSMKSLKSGNAIASRPIVSNSNLKLMLTVNGSTRQFTPNGDQFSYIWASISPNGKRILYYVSELGCYSCRLDGSDMVKLGEIRAPQWLDDNTVVGMRDYDDGITITSSTIVAKNLDGTEQRLTGDDIIALYPQVTDKAGKIAFSTIDGEIYIINYTK
ncbi:MAG: hypothetical protein IKX31_09435 [Muribaculaceae bacterium]|nr:hypothetical protein [Muribaculaceae bacterium]